MSLYELLAELNKLPSLTAVTARALVTVFSPDTRESSVKLANRLRRSGIPIELYPESGERLERQMRYADRSSIPFAIIVGPDEMQRNTYTLRNLMEGNQMETGYENLVTFLILNVDMDLHITFAEFDYSDYFRVIPLNSA